MCRQASTLQHCSHPQKSRERSLVPVVIFVVGVLLTPVLLETLSPLGFSEDIHGFFLLLSGCPLCHPPFTTRPQAMDVAQNSALSHPPCTPLELGPTIPLDSEDTQVHIPSHDRSLHIEHR